MSRLRPALLLLASSLTLGACAYDGYGYGGGYASVGYGGRYGGGYCDPYYQDCGGYYGDPWYGWYGDYYYPGWGVFVYDSYRRPYRWNDYQRRYWESRRGRWGDRDWNDRRWERWDGWDHRDGDRDWQRGDRNWNGGGDRNWRRDGDRRWRGRRGASNERVRPDSVIGTRAEAPRSGSEAVARESHRDWSGARSGERASGRSIRAPEAERSRE
jgi:hypothetical protein